MAGVDRWVRWIVTNRRGRPTKVPVQVDGRPASSTNAATWTSLKAAKASTVGSGFGFVLNGDGIVCLDLDHCLINGRLTDEAAAIVELAPDTFIEISPGGDGLHIFGFGHLAQGRKFTRNGLNIEAYGNGRYMTVTGRRHQGAPARLADISALLAAIL